MQDELIRITERAHICVMRVTRKQKEIRHKGMFTGFFSVCSVLDNRPTALVHDNSQQAKFRLAPMF